MAGASAEMAGALVGVWVSLSMESRQAYHDPRFPTWQLGPKKEKAEATSVHHHSWHVSFLHMDALSHGLVLIFITWPYFVNILLFMYF